MKLSNAQIIALQNSIIGEVLREPKEFNENLVNSKEYTDFEETDKVCLALADLRDKYNLDSYFIRKLMEDRKTMYFSKKLKRIHYPNSSEVYNDIILSTIDPDIKVDELIASLVKKYKK